MTEYSNIESMFPHFLKGMITNSPLKIREDIDYIELMCHANYDLKTHFDIAHDKFLKGIKIIYPKFDNYVVDFVFCILYFNGILNSDNFKNSLLIFNDDLKYINTYPGNNITFNVYNDNTYIIGTKNNLKVIKSDEIFNYDLPPLCELPILSWY